MKKWMLALAVIAVMASGCSKKDDTSTSSPTVSPTVSATVQPSAGASATPSGTNGGGAVTTAPTTTPKGTTGGGAAESPSPITKEQIEKITLTSTYDEVVKQTGTKGVLVKDENGKKTYQYVITNQPGYYAEIVFFSDGKISEKRVFQK